MEVDRADAGLVRSLPGLPAARGTQICRARADLSDGPPAPGHWEKFHKGTFTEPGIGGHETPVVNVNRWKEPVHMMADLHKHNLINCTLVFLFVFHSLYGIRTILLDLGVRAEKLLFWACNVLGSVLFAVFLILFFTLVRP